MLLARVIGMVWATHKYDDLEGATIQFIQPLDGDLKPVGRPIAAVDHVGAGEGEIIFYETAYEASIPFPRPLVPIDVGIMGIVETVDATARAEKPALPGLLPKGGAKP